MHYFITDLTYHVHHHCKYNCYLFKCAVKFITQGITRTRYTYNKTRQGGRGKKCVYKTIKSKNTEQYNNKCVGSTIN